MEEQQLVSPPGPSARRKALIGAFAALSLTGGSIAVAALTPGGIAGAQDDVSEQELPDESGDTNDADTDGKRDRSSRMSEVITSLVEDGTITQDQADAIAERFAEARANAADDAGGRRGHGARGLARRANLDTITEATGLTEEEVREGLRSGQSLGELAGDAVAELEAALLSDANDRIDAAVESGRLTDERAAELRENVPEQVQRRLSGEGRMRGPALGE